MKSIIYQIYYSRESKNKLDPAFTPLDNSQNERPDWREYWPIRTFLLSNELEYDTYYGFFSPKFKIKTNIDGLSAIQFHSGISNEIDLINFSPYFDQAAFYQNIFEQASSVHMNTTEKILRCVTSIYPELRISDIIMTSENTIFCNFFTAKKSFWIQWLSICEKIFNWAENSKSELFEDLNSFVNYGQEQVQFKVFLMERIASLLAHKENIKIIKFNINETEKTKNSIMENVSKLEFLKLDSYKMSYKKTLNKDYLTIFSEHRQDLLEKFKQ